MTILVTGGAGFIGSNFVLDWVASSDELVINVDKLTYAGNLENLETLSDVSSHKFVKADIADAKLISNLLTKYQVRAVIHFAAESHVDRSIHRPEEFIQTNIVGTFRLLDSVLTYWKDLDQQLKEKFRFLHVSTDEVFGSLNENEAAFHENSRYQPNSPYSASKAASDHLARAYCHTYGLPIIITNCSNNYGPLQFPEKLIPVCIHNALTGKSIPLYGNGKQIRDWLYVKDHCSAVRQVLKQGEIGETYNIGGWNEKTNIDVVLTICKFLDLTTPLNNKKSYTDQITYVKDRPGHDLRYAINASKIESELGWKPAENFETGIQKTVDWYLSNQDWVRNIMIGAYREKDEILYT